MDPSPVLVASLVKCANFAAVKHRKQRRGDIAKTPYINHPIGVAYILTEEGKEYDPSVIQAALLHDTVEDTDTTLEEIKEEFGDEVAGLVEEVTIDKSLSSRQQKEQLVAMTPSTSHKAKLVRLADKLYNMRDKLHNPRDPSRGNVQDYFEWSAKVVKGLRGTNALLEKEVDNLLMERNVYDLSV